MLITPRYINIQSQVPITLSVFENHTQAVTVLFYPGTMASPQMYPTLLQELYRLGCNVVGIHPLSHGLSPKIKKNFVFDDFLQNGRDAEAWVMENFSGPIVACGHSQGGILALAHSIDNPNIAATFPIGSLLTHQPYAIEITHFKSLKGREEKLLNILNKISNIFPRLPIPFFAYLSPAKIIANAYKAFAPREGCRATYPLCYIYSLFSANLTKVHEHGCIKCPVILITPKDDELFPLSIMEQLLTSINAPQKKLISITGGGHLAAVSRYYAKHIAAYIAAECAGLGLPLYTQNNNSKR